MNKPTAIVLISLAMSACTLDPEAIGKRMDESEPLQMYPGAHRAPADLAQIAVVGQKGLVLVEAIDGSSRRGAPGWSGYSFVHVLPGLHSVEVKYANGGVLTSGMATGTVQLTESLEARHTYAAHFDIDRDSKVHFKLVDYGVDVPRHCVLVGVRDGGPSAPSFVDCMRAPG